MKTLLDLANRMESLQRRIPLKASNLAADVARAIQRNLVNVTPVDTSKALSNWVLTVEEPFDLYLDAYREGFAGSTQEASASEALFQGEHQLRLKKPGMPIYITNNAPYIRALNDGSSMQEPAGFVERAVLIGRRVIEAKGMRNV